MSESHVIVMAACLCCGQPFSCNPHKVPSLRVHGEREPVCKTCMDWANAKRVELGLQPHPILPGAYEPIPESEL